MHCHLRITETAVGIPQESTFLNIHCLGPQRCILLDYLRIEVNYPRDYSVRTVGRALALHVADPRHP